MKKRYQKPEILTVTTLPQDRFMEQIFDSSSPSSVKSTVMESNEYDDSASDIWNWYEE